MSKYNMINVLMGRSADYNDKLADGKRSLKFMGFMSDEDYIRLVSSVRLIDYVFDVYKVVGKYSYVRFIVKEVK